MNYISFLTILISLYAFKSFSSDESAYQAILKQATVNDSVDWNEVPMDPQVEMAVTGIVLIELVNPSSGKAQCLGSGFFLEEDFPVIHTAEHIFSSCNLDHVQIEVYDPSSANKRKKFAAKKAQLVSRDGDHLGFRLSEIESEIKKIVKPLKRGHSLPALGEKISALGHTDGSGLYKSNGVASVCVDFARSSLKPSEALTMSGYKKMFGDYYEAAEPTEISVPTLGEMNYQLIKKLTDGEASFMQPKLFCGHSVSQQGMSGGPLLNAKGEVVGINSAMASLAGTLTYFIDVTSAQK